MITDTSSAEFFEAKYRCDADPWNFTGSAYELERYEAVMNALAGRRYRRAFEPGCSIGVLSRRLATISHSVEAIDFSETAIAEAKSRSDAEQNIQFVRAALGDYSPAAETDLIVLSEVGYYFTPDELSSIASQLISALEPGATILAAHWLGYSPDHRLSGDAVHNILRSQKAMVLEHEERHTSFRIDRWRRV